MSDFPYLAPPEDGLRAAMAAARRRRLRSGGWSTSGIAAVVLAIVALAGGQGTQSLVQQPAPEQPAVTQLVPDHGTRSSSARPNQAGMIAAAGSAAGPANLAGPVGAQPVSRRAAPRRQGTTGVRARYVAGPIDRQDNAETNPTPCTLSASAAVDTTGLCPYAGVMGDGSRDNPFVLQAQVCSHRTSLTLLHYRGANEVDLAVYRVDADQHAQEVWRWSRSNADSPSDHTLGLEAASCTDWTFTWTQVTSSGSRLGPGTYELRASFLADELRSYPTPTAGFTIS